MTQTTNPAVAARRRRVHAIRVRVATGAVALFIALFAGLYVQLASGNDPALSKSSTAQVASGTSSTTSGTTTTTDQAPMTTQAS